MSSLKQMQLAGITKIGMGTSYHPSSLESTKQKSTTSDSKARQPTSYRGKHTPVSTVPKKKVILKDPPSTRYSNSKPKQRDNLHLSQQQMI